MEYKNIIFDLGGVILNIDYQITIDQFKKLGIPDFEALFTQANQEKLFDYYEMGKISSDEFVMRLLEKMPGHVNELDVINAWNAMLLDLPDERLKLLKRLNSHYNTSLLSNTNEIHLDAFHTIIRSENDIQDLTPYFDRVFFSCDMKMRKPDPAIFKAVCEYQGYEPKDTLFIDDSIQHVAGAKSAGLNAYHLINKDLCGVFDQQLNFIGG